MPVARTLLFGEQGSTKAARPCRRFPMQMFLSFFWIKRPRPCLFRPYRQGSGSLVFPLFSRPVWEFPGGPFAVYRRTGPGVLEPPAGRCWAAMRPNILLCSGASRKTYYGWLCFFIPLPVLTCAFRYAPNKKVMIKMKISKQITGRSKTPNRFFHIAPNKIRNRSNKKDA